MRRARSDGFTLIELTISVAILVIIIAALTSALIAFYKTGSETARRDDHNSGASLVGTYLNRDLAASTTADTSSPGSACSGQANVLVASWKDYTATDANPSPAPSSSYVVAYALTPDTVTNVPGLGSRKQLERWMCRDGSQVDHQVLIGDLASVDFKTGSSASCGDGQAVSLILNRFENDNSATVPPYNYVGCVGSRQQ